LENSRRLLDRASLATRSSRSSLLRPLLAALGALIRAPLRFSKQFRKVNSQKSISRILRNLPPFGPATRPLSPGPVPNPQPYMLWWRIKCRGTDVKGRWKGALPRHPWAPMQKVRPEAKVPRPELTVPGRPRDWARAGPVVRRYFDSDRSRVAFPLW
jgi:hypothetical protein